jgi:hypothetical protein
MKIGSEEEETSVKVVLKEEVAKVEKEEEERQEERSVFQVFESKQFGEREQNVNIFNRRGSARLRFYRWPSVI